MKNLFVVLISLLMQLGYGQEIAAFEAFKARAAAIEAFTAEVVLRTDIDFLNMPEKHAVMTYKKGKGVKLTSDDFVMVPKRGLDLALSELFAYPHITVDRGMADIRDISCMMLNVIPTDRSAEFSIATVYLDPENERVVQAEIHTTKEGVYTVDFFHGDSVEVLPEKVEVSFEVARVKIPVRYLAREGKVDKEAMKSEGTKTGRIILELSDYQIEQRQIK